MPDRLRGGIKICRQYLPAKVILFCITKLFRTKNAFTFPLNLYLCGIYQLFHIIYFKLYMNAFQLFIHWLFPASNSRRRLTDKLPILRSEIDTYKLQAGAELDKKNWLKIADQQFADLEKAIERREIQQGWKIFKNISRILIYSLAEQAGKPHLSRAKSIFHETVGKTEADSWRHKAIVELLGKPDPADPAKWAFNEAVSTENIVKANELLDEHQDNFYEKLITLNLRIRVLSWTAVGAIILFIVIGPKVGEFPYHSEIPENVVDEMRDFLREVRNRDSLIASNGAVPDTSAGKPAAPAVETVADDTASGAQPDTPNAPAAGIAAQSDTPKPPASAKQKDSPGVQKTEKPGKKEKKTHWWSGPINSNPRLLAILVILMGIIGAVVSGFLRVIEAESNNRIPDQLFGNTILSARLVFATVAALAVYIFLGTGLLLLFTRQISFELLLAFCFIAGFSEQLVKKGVETLTKEEMYKGQKPK